MEDVAQRFYSWLLNFTVIASAVLIGAHLTARWLRLRTKPPPLPSAEARREN
jgi:hypothetical protein